MSTHENQKEGIYLGMCLSRSVGHNTLCQSHYSCQQQEQ